MRLSTSRASTYLTCPKKYEYLYVAERESKQKDSAREYGVAWHSLMESRWLGRMPEPLSGLGPHFQSVLEATYDTYCDLYPLTEKVIEVEQGHVVPLGDNELEVRWDALVEVGGRKFLVEHKTTSSDISPDSFYWKRLDLDQQVSWYVLAARSLGHAVDGVIYDVVRKPALRKGKNETMGAFTARCVSAIRNEPEKYFHRELITRSKADLASAEENLRGAAKLMQYGVWPMNPRSCFDFSRVCEYHGVCTHTESLSDDRLFQVRKKT